jgi:hypothetical protein
MKFRNTLFLLLLALLLASYIIFVDKHKPTTKEAMEQSRRVVEVDRDKINAVTIQNTDTRIELKKDANNTWQLEAPVKDRADSMTVDQLFTSIETLRHDAAIGADGKGAEKDQIKEFGVSNPETRIKFTGPEKSIELLLGKDAAVEGKIYARVEGSNTVYVISNDLKTQVTKKADDFRDRKLTDLNAAQVTRLLIKRGADELDLEKKDQHWSLVKPLKARGDDSKIGDLVSRAVTAKIDTFLHEAGNAATYGLDQPRGTVSLFKEGATEPVVLQIGANPKEEKDKEKVYARLSSRDAVLLVPKSIEQILETKPNDLRDKHLARFETDIVDRVTIEPAGREKIVLARNGESWVRKADKDLPVNSALVSRLLDDLRTQEVAAFVSDVATDLAKYGLDQPPLKITVSAFASENTAETKAGEKPIVALLFGKMEGENVYARTDDEPFIVSVSKKILESIPTDAVQLQELTIYKMKPEEFTALEVTRAGQPPVSLEKNEKQWKLAKGDEAINQTNVQSLVNTLAGLRAVRWIGPVAPEHGLDHPTVLVTFKTSAANASGKLTVGGTTADAMSYATAEGMNGVFAISKPDFDALQLPLIDKPAPTTPPAPAAPGGSTPPPAPGAANAPPASDRSTVPPVVTPPVEVPRSPTPPTNDTKK